MDFFDKINSAIAGRAEAEQRSVEAMRRDWRELFTGSDLGKQVLGDMLSLTNWNGMPATANRQEVAIWLGLRQFISMIVHFAGLDDVRGFATLHQVQAIASKNREIQAKTDDEA